MVKSRFAYGLLAILCFSIGRSDARADEPFLCQCLTDAQQSEEYSIAGRRVELFQALADDQIEAELIAPSAREVYLRVTNKTDGLLKIDLPDAFAAVPVLGQLAPAGNFGGGNGLGLPGLGAGNNLGGGANLGNFAGGNFGGGNLAGGQGGQGGQGLGGGFNNGGNAMGNLGGGNVGGGNLFGNGAGNQLGNPGGFRPGMFRVPAGRVGKIRAQTVCLEHGKPDPNSRMRYRIVPIEDFNSDSRIAWICSLLARQEISQNVAQAAAWHVANGLGWEELAAKERVRSKYTGNQKFFTSSELKLAARVVRAAEATAAPEATGSPQTLTGLISTSASR